MTDLKPLFDSATEIANRVTDLAGDADTLTDRAAYGVTEARRALEGLPFDDERAAQQAVAALEAARETLKACHEIAGMIAHGLASLDTEDLVCSLDDAQYDQEDAAGLAEMFRDVERGIRDPSELRYAIERIEPNYVL
jgi:hypothetical protein